MKPYSSSTIAGVYSLIGAITLVGGTVAILHGITKHIPENVALGAYALCSAIACIAIGSALESLNRTAYWTEYNARMPKPGQRQSNYQGVRP